MKKTVGSSKNKDMNDLKPKSGFCNYVVSSSSESDEEEKNAKSVDQSLCTNSVDSKCQKVKNEEHTEKVGSNLNKNEKKSEKRPRSRSPDYSRRRSHSRERHRQKNWGGDRGDWRQKNRYGSRHDTHEDGRNRRDSHGGGGGRRRDFDDQREIYRSADKRPRSSYNEKSTEGSNSQEQKMSQQMVRISAKNFEEKSVKLKEMVEKRKMLWQHGSQEKKVAGHWGAMLAACSDDKQAEKLKKLIGLKAGVSTEQPREESGAQTSSNSAPIKDDEERQKPTVSSEDSARLQQARLFNDLNVQYEMGRMSTHMHRGVGLGFASQLHDFATQHPSVSGAPGASSAAASNCSTSGKEVVEGRR